MRDKHSPPPHEQHHNRHSIRNVQQDSARRDVGAKRNRRPQVQQAEAHVEDVAEEDGAHRHIQLGLDVGEELVEDDAAVAGHGEKQAARAGDAGVGAVDEADCQHEGEDGGAGAAVGCAVDHFDDGHAGGGAEDGFWVVEAEEDGEDEDCTSGGC